MINLRHRSYQKELMDGDDISFAAMAQTLKELNIVNTRLGGHAITINGVKQLINNNQTVTICEIGCGGGDNLNAIYKYCCKNNISINRKGAKLMGIFLRVHNSTAHAVVTEININ